MPPLTNFLYISPRMMFSLNANVTGSVVNATYDPKWLCDNLPGRPVHSGTTSPSWTISNTPNNVNCVAAVNWNLDGSNTINVTGGVTGTITQPEPWGPVPLNGFYYTTTPVQIGSLTIGCSGNSVQVVAGEVMAGFALQLERPIDRRGRRIYVPMNNSVSPQMGNVAITPLDKSTRRFSGQTVLTDVGLLAVEEWYRSTNDGQYLSLIIPDPLVNDAWAVRFDGEFQYEKFGPNIYMVTLNFIESPRIRW